MKPQLSGSWSRVLPSRATYRLKIQVLLAPLLHKKTNQKSNMNFSKLFSFKGRVGRAEYILTSMAFAAPAQIVAEILRRDPNSGLEYLLLALTLVLFAGSIPVAVKRYHDLGDSGWLLLRPLGLLLLAGLLFALAFGGLGRPVLFFALVVFSIGGFWALAQSVRCIFFAGAAGANLYGAPESGSVQKKA